PYCWLARAYERLGRISDAKTAYEKAVRIDQSFENVALVLGQLYLREGKTTEGERLVKLFTTMSANTHAFSVVRQKVQQHPNDPDAHLAVARWYVKTGVLPKGILEYRRTLELRPTDRSAREGLRHALIASNRKTEAVALR